MPRASRILNDEQRQRINRAVVDAERHTAAEIVPVVAHSSGRYDRPEDIAGLTLGLVLLALTWLFIPEASDTVGDWSGVSAWVELLALLAAVLAGFLIGAAIAAYVPAIRLLFTPRRQMRDEVAARARQAFFDRSVHHTADATGLLIYISLYERQAVVLADREIIDKLGQSALDELCRQLTSRLKTEPVDEALAAVIAAAGERLSAVLPRTTDDVNELSDALVVLD